MKWRFPRAVVIAAALVASLSCGNKKASPAAEQQAAPAPSKQTALSQGEAGTSEAKLRANCDNCRARWCSNFEGVDLVAGCFEKPDPKHVTKPDPEFTAHCKAVVDCAYKHNCAYDRARGPVHCYCGSRFVDECKNQGPAADAPCVAEWQAAARSKDNMEVLVRFDQVEFPSGWAFHLLQCDRERCGATSPLGRCTP